MSGALGGLAVYEKQYKKLKFFEQYVDFIVSIKNEIRYSGKNLYDILSNYKCENPFKNYINKSIENLSKFSFENSWEKSFKFCSRDLGISNAEKNLIINFGAGLGKNDIQSQIYYCEHNLEAAKPYLEKMRLNHRLKGKLSIILGVGFGMIAALLII